MIRTRQSPLNIVIPIISISWHGGTRVLVQFANFLAERGHRVEFLVARNRCRTPFAFSNAVVIRDIGIHTGIKALDYFVFLCLVPIFIRKPSIVIANFFVTYFPIRFIALFRGVVYVYFVQDIESKFEAPLGSLLNPLCRWTYSDRHIVAANFYLRRRLEQEFGTTCKSICIGPDDIFFDLSKQSEKNFDVIYFLRRETWKGLDRFLRILSLAKGRFTCLCVSQDEGLRGVLDGMDAVFYRPQNDVDLVRCMDSARVLLLTSYREGFALPPLEGMARGLPTLLFACGGPEQYIRDGENGIYVSTEQQAVDVIDSLVRDHVRYSSMSRAAASVAGEYRLRPAFSEFEQIIEARGSSSP
jgi:glycosyltransferase involved in cell wall biosynthesis